MFKSNVIAICGDCKSPMVSGEGCKKCACKDEVTMVQYAQAMKTAVECWQKAACEEHPVVCQPAVQEFALALTALQKRVKELEVAILAHREKSTTREEADEELYKHL
jgi:hypothetical protein